MRERVELARAAAREDGGGPGVDTTSHLRAVRVQADRADRADRADQAVDRDREEQRPAGDAEPSGEGLRSRAPPSPCL